MITNESKQITFEEFSEILGAIEEQPKWRHTADKEMDYADGNQLDSELLAKQRELGIPPAIEDVISPALLSIQGYEATIRTDWRVTPDGEEGGQDVADALNYRLNQAERKSRADKACSDAFRTQIACGIGWVEVSRETDPFKFPYRCNVVHRNEIYWDTSSTQSDLSDAKWLLRQRWIAADRLELMFPQCKEVISGLSKHGSGYFYESLGDGGHSTGFENAWGDGRHPTISEERWRNSKHKELCVSELWYRRWENVVVLQTEDGRIFEYDEDNIKHNVAIMSGKVQTSRATVSRMHRAYFIGDYKLADSKSPYPHQHFPYVPFFGFREDATGIPYGYVRSMKYAQDNLNSGNSKLRWGMSVVRVERTKGAVAMSDAQFRRQIARSDADIVLDEQHMRQPGARFEVRRDYELSAQHYQMLNDARATIQRVSSVTSGFMGKSGNATSGYQEQMQIEQSNQALARMMDNFREARSQVGELLLAMIIEDMGTKQQRIVISGDVINREREVYLNVPEKDPETGFVYLSNDISRVRLKVSLEDVPSTTSYRVQQLNAFSEALKSLPAEYQAAALPFMVSLMDIPNKEKVIEAIDKVHQNITPEQMQEQVDQAVKDALVKSGHDIKARELEIKERKVQSEIREIDARSVQLGVQAAYAAMQSGAQIAQMPQIAPIADMVMQSAGYVRPAQGDDPNYPTPPEGLVSGDEVQSVHNTDPMNPPTPASANGAMQGIETPAVSDNLPAGM